MKLFGCKHRWKRKTEVVNLYLVDEKGKKTKSPFLEIYERECIKCGKISRVRNFSIIKLTDIKLKKIK